jgi:hypothetical protein
MRIARVPSPACGADINGSCAGWTSGQKKTGTSLPLDPNAIAITPVLMDICGKMYISVNFVDLQLIPDCTGT